MLDILGSILDIKSNTLSDKLLKLVDDLDIYTELIGFDVDIGEQFSSPIRHRDDFPSFSLFLPTRVPGVREDAVWFKDLADGRWGDIFKFTKYIAEFKYDTKLNSRFEIIKFIDSQLQLGMFSGNGKRIEKVKRDYAKYRRAFDIKVQYRDFTPNDLKYWGNIGVNPATLKLYDIFSVKFLLREDGVVRKKFRLNEFCYFYEIWDKGKLYQPYAEKAFKFRNSCPGNDYRYFQGFKQLMGSNTLIITKSLKDIVVFYEHLVVNLEYNVDLIAPHAETINLEQDFIEFCRVNYERVITVSDFDPAGVAFAQQCKRLGFEYRFVSTKREDIDGKLKVKDKDIADFRYNHGKRKTLKLLRKWKIN